MIKQVSDQISLYLQQTGGYDPNSFISILRKELSSIGVIDGGDTLNWITPNGFRFNIDRVPNAYIACQSSPQYTVIIKVFDSMNIQITEFRFSEYDAIDLILSIAGYVDSRMINPQQFYFNPTNTAVGYHVLTIKHANGSNIPPQTTLNSGLYNIELSVYSSFNESFAHILSFDLNTSELVDFCFSLFFQCLIDIDFEELIMNGVVNNAMIGMMTDFVYNGTTPSGHNLNTIPIVANQDANKNTVIGLYKSSEKKGV